MKPRKPLHQMGQDDNQPKSIAGQPADVCPYCGCVMIAYKTQTMQTRVQRYVVCRNNNCGKRFVSTQPQVQPPPPKLLREVGGDELSNLEQSRLTLVRESA